MPESPLWPRGGDESHQSEMLRHRSRAPHGMAPDPSDSPRAVPSALCAPAGLSLSRLSRAAGYGRRAAGPRARAPRLPGASARRRTRTRASRKAVARIRAALAPPRARLLVEPHLDDVVVRVEKMERLASRAASPGRIGHRTCALTPLSASRLRSAWTSPRDIAMQTWLTRFPTVPVTPTM
jgi:hypothetical protein